jgi:hypothetical protein
MYNYTYYNYYFYLLKYFKYKFNRTRAIISSILKTEGICKTERANKGTSEPDIDKTTRQATSSSVIN